METGNLEYENKCKELQTALQELIDSINPRSVKYIDNWGPSVGIKTMPDDEPIYNAIQILEKYKEE